MNYFAKCVLALLLGTSALAHAQLKNESEAGLATANGNTKTQTYTFKQFNSYTFDKNILQFKGRYLNTRAGANETARYLNLGLRYERELSERFSTFLGGILERDKFANIDHRYITDVGGKYSITKSERTIWFAELGYRYMAEYRYDVTKAFSHYVRAYSEIERKWNEQFTTKYWLELLPNISESNDYQMNMEGSLSAMLNSIFSLKTSMLLRYDHQPAPGIQHETDTLLTTALVAKF